MISHTNDQTQNGYVTRRLFSWDIGSKEDKDNLRSFLKQKLKRDWVDNAKVSKTRARNRIKISDGLNSVFITMNLSKTKAALVSKRKKVPEVIYEFVVDGSYVYTCEPYRSYLRTLDPSRLPPTISSEELHITFFHLFLTMRVQQLIFSILSNNVEPGYSTSMQILSQDSKFVQALKETKNQFDKKCTFSWKSKIIMIDIAYINKF